MRFLRCVHAEFLLVLPRLARTRLGLALLAVGCSLVWLHGHGLDAPTVILQAGALGAIVGAAGVVGHDNDRAALRTILTHPTTPLAIAAGRWLAVALPATVLALACTVAIGGMAGALLGGVFAAAAGGGGALALVLPLRRPAGVSRFLFISVAGPGPPAG